MGGGTIQKKKIKILINFGHFWSLTTTLSDFKVVVANVRDKLLSHAWYHSIILLKTYILAYCDIEFCQFGRICISVTLKLAIYRNQWKTAKTSEIRYEDMLCFKHHRTSLISFLAVI